MSSIGWPAVLGLAAGAFVGTNIDNAVVTVAMVAAAPVQRATRIVLGQVIGFTVLVAASMGMAVLLFEIPTRVVGLLGLVPIALGLRGLAALRHAEGRSRLAQRAFGTGALAATLVTVSAGGDNLAVYIPLFRLAGVGGTALALAVFAGLEVVFTFLIRRAGRNRVARATVSRVGVFAAPILYCTVGVVVLIEARTFSLL